MECDGSFKAKSRCGELTTVTDGPFTSRVFDCAAGAADVVGGDKNQGGAGDRKARAGGRSHETFDAVLTQQQDNPLGFDGVGRGIEFDEFFGFECHLVSVATTGVGVHLVATPAGAVARRKQPAPR